MNMKQKVSKYMLLTLITTCMVACDSGSGSKGGQPPKVGAQPDQVREIIPPDISGATGLKGRVIQFTAPQDSIWALIIRQGVDQSTITESYGLKVPAASHVASITLLESDITPVGGNQLPCVTIALTVGGQSIKDTFNLPGNYDSCTTTFDLGKNPMSFEYSVTMNARSGSLLSSGKKSFIYKAELLCVVASKLDIEQFRLKQLENDKWTEEHMKQLENRPPPPGYIEAKMPGQK